MASTSALPTCEVCCLNFNRAGRRPAVCPFCDYQACACCVKQYLTSLSSDPACMACKKAWDREVISDVMPKTFLSDHLKKSRQDILFEREKSLLPATQPYAEIEVRKERNKPLVQAVDQEIRALEDRIAFLSSKKVFLQEGETEEDAEEHARHGRPREKPAKARREFIRACPADGCRGFLSSQWKCGLCEVHVCKGCHEIKEGDEHECKPENVETARLLAKDTKPCPKCAAMIFKMEGCDQMYCTQCHTPFSWKTGQVETGRIHNPHYYEYMRARGQGQANREVGDLPCGGIPSYLSLQNKCDSFKMDKKSINKMIEKLRILTHMHGVELPRFRVDQVEGNRDLRVEFLVNRITEKQFKATVHNREKKNQRKQYIFDIYNFLVTVLTDLFQRLTSDDTKTLKDARALTGEMEQAIDYANERLKKMSKMFDMKELHFNDWKLVYAFSGHPY